MTEFPALFVGAEFRPLDTETLATLTPQRQQLYADVREAAEAVAQFEAELQAAVAAVPIAAAEAADAEKACAKGRRSFMSLWRETTGKAPRHGNNK